MKDKRKYKYFIAYDYVSNIGDRRVGNCVVGVDNKINSYEQIKELEHVIREDTTHKVVVINNWKILKYN